MSKTTTNVMPGWMRPWEQFWFTPADPSLLGLLRIACGMIVVYTFVVYTFSLQDFMGENAWHDMTLRNQLRHDRPVNAGTLGWNPAGNFVPPRTPFEVEYLEAYFKKWKVQPPPPYPRDLEEVKLLDEFIVAHGIDLRVNGAPIPSGEHRDFQLVYASRYTQKWKGPPPAYARDIEEAREIDTYMDEFNSDPRRLYDRGMPVWSLWFHVVDPDVMLALHFGFVVCSVLFLIGFCTRLTTALTWFGLLCYIHRNPSVLFGVDTMMLIVITYLMISPCGAICSVDALIRRWWAGAKPGVVAAWCRFWKMEPPATIVPAAPAEPAPSVSANVAIRLLQINVCIIYLMAGLSKLQGQAWWNGGALWLTLGNYEFAPMQFDLYLKSLRFIGKHQWLFDGIMSFGGLFTLAFEIGYAFLIWRSRLRWVFLASAILLHGFIGLFMGLKTFSLIMLVMNMAFLSTNEVLWLLSWFGPWRSGVASLPAAPSKQPLTAAASTGITQK